MLETVCGTLRTLYKILKYIVPFKVIIIIIKTQPQSHHRTHIFVLDLLPDPVVAAGRYAVGEVAVIPLKYTHTTRRSISQLPGGRCMRHS